MLTDPGDGRKSGSGHGTVGLLVAIGARKKASLSETLKPSGRGNCVRFVHSTMTLTFRMLLRLVSSTRMLGSN
jgi:hypothetical protein